MAAAPRPPSRGTPARVRGPRWGRPGPVGPRGRARHSLDAGRDGRREDVGWRGRIVRRGAAARGADVAKKKKVRVAFRKNRQKRTRANDLTQRFHGDVLEGA